jgi:C4-dicarboxylate transporter DctM subunit
MEPSVALILILLVALLLIGVEIFTIFGIGAFLLTAATQQFPFTNISLTMFDALNLFPLIALPLFVLTGDLVAEGGIAKQIMNFARAAVGWVRGGLVLTAIFACGIFAAISGSNAATVATIGRMMMGTMAKEGYPLNFTAATVACGGCVGIIIPPSIMFVLYGVTVGVSVSDLFIAGILPGIVMVVLMGVAGYLACRRQGFGEEIRFAWPNFFKSLWDTKYATGAILLMLVGIYAGIFTPTEAGAVASAYCLLVGLLITRKINLKTLPAVMSRSSKICGLIVPLIAVAVVFSQNLAVLRLPDLMTNSLMDLSDSNTGKILLVLVILLIAGCIMEAAPNVLLLAPILAPVGISLGFHPVHFGVVLVCALAIGFITPPIGLNLFVASAVSGVPVARIINSTFPYFAMLLIALLIITFWPALSLALIKTEAGIRLW